MSDVEGGLALSSTTDEIQDHSNLMDFQTLLQQLPTSSTPQNVRNALSDIQTKYSCYINNTVFHFICLILYLLILDNN